MKPLLFICTCFVFAVFQTAFGQTTVHLNDLSAFGEARGAWKMAGSVRADLSKRNVLTTTPGTAIIVNTPGKKNPGSDLFTNDEYGDFDLELDYLVAVGSNSGIYLHGRYEVQLHDTWGRRQATSATNGGIYERWDRARPAGSRGLGGIAPRMNVSRAPGLWQTMKISFQAPRFDASGNKIRAARLLSVELNGVVIHENIELPGPTRGGRGQESARGPLRFQGDHGAVAFRNIRITEFEGERPEADNTGNGYRVYPIAVNANESSVFRSFMDLPDGTRISHAVSVASDEKVHYTYDTGTGMIVQVWRGDFLDATPMWFRRGDGSSRPTGAVLHFGTPAPVLSRLASAEAPWKTDSVGTDFRPKGYTLDIAGRPIFIWQSDGVTVRDAIHTLADGEGISRVITLDQPAEHIYVRIAQGPSITKITKDTYLIGDHSYFLKFDNPSAQKAVVRDAAGGKELIVPVRERLKYSILF